MEFPAVSRTPSDHAHTAGSMTVSHLRCEYLVNPQGIDVPAPRLSWVLESDVRGQKQTAYRVMVASSAENLAAGKADLWDSGKVSGDQTIHVVYRGKPLKTRMQCFWKVQVWDKNGSMQESCEPAFWSMGLLKPSDWQAKWIAAPGNPPPPPPGPHNGFHSKPVTSPDTPQEVTIDLGAERTVDGVRLFPSRPWDYTPKTEGFLFPVRFKIEAGRESDPSDAITVVDQSGADVPNPGNEALLYRFGPVSARYVRLSVSRLGRRPGPYFVLRNQPEYGFALAEMQVLSGEENLAKGASVIAEGAVESAGWGRAKLVDGYIKPHPGGVDDGIERPATMVRKEFRIAKPIKQAVVSVTGLGLYELRINGRRVGDHVLAPEWTLYCKRIQYQTYDVTELLRTGENAIGALIGGGWWAGPIVFQQPPQNAKPCLLMRLDIELADGNKQTIFTDHSWQATVDGPIRNSGIYLGEIYDATKEMPEWDKPGFDAAAWQPVEILPNPDDAGNAKLVAQLSEPIRIKKELRPIALTEPKPGVYVFDLGQNIVGWCRLRVNVPAGTKITVRHAESTYDDGTLFVDNLGSISVTDRYTCRGGEQVLEPHFTYHGFRYVEVTGLPSRPTEDVVTGCVFHSDAPEAGTFECSNDLVNKLMRCIEWTQRGNIMSVPTDCPQRNERLGWMGDAGAFSQTGVFIRDMAAFFNKWVRDMRDSQADDGRFTDYAPYIGDLSGPRAGAPGCGDAALIVPWNLYHNYGDVRVLEEHYEAAKQWVEFIRSANPSLLWENNRGDDYGDWLNGGWLTGDGRESGIRLPQYPRGQGEMPHDVFATAFFAHSVDLLARMAKVLNRSDDSAKYSQLFEDIKAAFNRAYVSADGKIKGDNQGGYTLALHFNLLGEEMRPKAVQHLLAAIERFLGHPSTGIQTSHRMMLELSRKGQHDEACRLINLRTVPSWGYMVEMGATTIWERWDALVKGRTRFVGEGSLNHPVFGSVGEWIWRELAGINPDENAPGYKHMIIRPRPCPSLTWVKAEYDSIRGKIISNWKQEHGKLVLDVTIPANTTATVYLPMKAGLDASKITESGKPLSQAPGVKKLAPSDASLPLEVPSGHYRFEIPGYMQ